MSQYAHRKRQDVSTHDKEIVPALRAALAERIGGERFELWFGGRTRLDLSGQTLCITAPDRFLLDRLRNSFREDVEAVCHRWFGSTGRVEFRCEEQAVSSTVKRCRQPVRVSRPCSASKERTGGKTRSAETDGGGRRLATLDNFVVGDTNRMAFTGTRSAVDDPGRITPLFLYGPSGTGKTHLLQAIASTARRLHGMRRVVLLSAEQFTASFLEALRGSGLPSFRRKYRDVEVLLIDDLQFFIGKSATIVELLHTADSLLREGRQLVLSASLSPGELGALGGELIGRISGGLVCGIERPDEPTRLGIARELAAAYRSPVPDEVLRRIAAELAGDARLIAGALNRLAAASTALEQPIDSALAETALGDLFRSARRVVQLSDIESAVCEVFGIDVKSLQSERKSKAISQPRMLAMWLARKYTRAAFAEIGQYFGRRSHSTVISAQKNVERWVTGGTRIQMGYGDCDVRDAIRRVETRLGTG